MEGVARGENIFKAVNLAKTVKQRGAQKTTLHHYLFETSEKTMDKNKKSEISH